MEIIPAILENKFEDIQEKIEFLVSIERKYDIDFQTVQIDLCDGVFVENTTWLPGEDFEKELAFLDEYRSFFNYEFHLMCKNQLEFFSRVEKLKAWSVVIHIEELLNTKELIEIIERAKNSYIKVVISAKIDFLEKVKEDILTLLENYEDMELQIMGIEKIGVQGQEFSERSLSLIRFFRKNFTEKELSIQVDGSVNLETIGLIRRAGANKALVGSYLLGDLREEEFVIKTKSLYRA